MSNLEKLLSIENKESENGPFLSPVEKPKGFFMKIAYFFTKRQMGKVISPLKIHSARLPFAFGKFYQNIPSLDKKLILSKEMIMLIRERVASINMCNFCIDLNQLVVISELMNKNKFNDLRQYKTSPLFDEKERVILDYVSELTINKKVDQKTFTNLLPYLTEREICEIVYIVASEHLYNITNIGLNINSDLLCDAYLNKKVAK